MRRLVGVAAPLLDFATADPLLFLDARINGVGKALLDRAEAMQPSGRL
jgi:hypothetical protein